MVMVFNATFNNISAISWQSVLLVEETGVSRENHSSAASHWQTLSHNIVSSTAHLSRIWTHNFSGDRHWLHRKVVNPNTIQSGPWQPLIRKVICNVITDYSWKYDHVVTIIRRVMWSLRVGRQAMWPLTTVVENKVMWSLTIAGNKVMWLLTSSAGWSFFKWYVNVKIIINIDEWTNMQMLTIPI